ncbi:MAG TPA: hypothetical protein VGF96_17555 [Terracidiphilus sp.]|jgi:hypothetical protein
MSAECRLSYTMLGGSFTEDEIADYAMTNDSFGSVHIADSTGLDEDMETGDAKTYNLPTLED